jgi:mono/diheme cytochrome c family protein
VVFVQNCQGCHAPPGQPDQPGPGPLPDYPKLGGDTLVMGQNPATVLRIILQGAESPVTPNEHTTYSMPSFATLGDREIADVATYIRNSWGNHAEPVSRSEVRSVRTKISS